jgi:serine/threonine protein kinase
MIPEKTPEDISMKLAHWKSCLEGNIESLQSVGNIEYGKTYYYYKPNHKIYSQESGHAANTAASVEQTVGLRGYLSWAASAVYNAYYGKGNDTASVVEGAQEINTDITARLTELSNMADEISESCIQSRDLTPIDNMIKDLRRLLEVNRSAYFGISMQNGNPEQERIAIEKNAANTLSITKLIETFDKAKEIVNEKIKEADYEQLDKLKSHKTASSEIDKSNIIFDEAAAAEPFESTSEPFKPAETFEDKLNRTKRFIDAHKNEMIKEAKDSKEGYIRIHPKDYATRGLKEHDLPFGLLITSEGKIYIHYHTEIGGRSGQFKIGKRAQSSEQNEIAKLVIPYNQKLSNELINKEIHILKMVKGLPHIVQLYTNVEYKDKAILYIQYCAGGQLDLSDPQLTLDQKKQIFLDIVEGVMYLHKLNIVHGDLKPDNILLDENKRGVISDLGTAEQVGKISDLGGTPYYQDIAHVIAFYQVYVKKEWVTMVSRPEKDIYALGCILYEILNGQLPPWCIGADKLEDLITNMYRIDFPEPNALTNPWMHMCWRMLQQIPEQRPTAEEVLTYLSPVFKQENG